MSELTLTGVSRLFDDVTAVRDVTLTVPDGEFLVLVGPSGCGKSTLLRLIAGLDVPDGGDIAIDGDSVVARPPRDRHVAMVFQNYALYPHMTVRGNIAFGLKVRKAGPQVIHARVREVAELLDLTGVLDRKPSQLSGGQRQRVALGRAIATEPALFLMDEPLSNLDAKLRTTMRAEIKKLQRRIGTTTIYVTHDQVEALTMGDRIAVMQGGEIMQVGTPSDIYDTPAHRFVGEFIGAPPMNFFDCVIPPNTPPHVLGREFSVPARLKARGEVTVGVRPEHIALAGAGDISVTHVETLGPEALVYCEYERTVFVVRVESPTSVQPGDAISVAINPEKGHYFDPATGERL